MKRDSPYDTAESGLTAYRGAVTPGGAAAWPNCRVENGGAFYTHRPTGPAEMIRRPIGTSLFEADKPSASSSDRCWFSFS